MIHQTILWLYYFFRRFYLFVFRGWGNEGESEGEKHRCVGVEGNIPCGVGNVAQPLTWKIQWGESRHTGPEPMDQFSRGE